ncbi:hypothetical protein [Leptothoe kymatousa]|uniref:Uncharacterized protein n=1 Tax=Leptothoe kymatousa TAU-MAC 1615 TaxID=2364775 RepID=A0ABS5XZ68_9CYAN|nr:hypothetical protein [Leptothoe kymatousa]MBT9310895.1 hypothetical protein [Leptothoe kymatousa TAU-MAC 1615]
MTINSSSVRPKVLLGILLGTLSLGVAAPQASANPLLEALPGGSIINSILGGQSQSQPAPLPLPPMDLGSDNVRNNNFNLCVVSCGGALPGGALPGGVSPQARPLPPQGIPQGRPPQARPPVPSRGPAPAARPAAPTSPTLVVPPIPIRL